MPALHSYLGSDAYIVPRAQHELLELPVGEMGQVKTLYEEQEMVKILFPEIGTAFVSWQDARKHFDFLITF